MKVVFFFCTDPSKDPVAPAVYEACLAHYPSQATEIVCDGVVVREVSVGPGQDFYLVATSEVVSHDFKRYLPLLQGVFSDCWFAGLVNWHQGNNAPPRIFCAHTNGDVPSGVFGASDPAALSAVLRSMEQARRSAALSDWSVTPEATHFAGTQYGTDASILLSCPVPLFDIEIGSDEACWSDQRAVDALASSLGQVFAQAENNQARSLLFVGGIHFEPSLRDAVIGPKVDWQVGHVLPNQWLLPDAYTLEAGRMNLLKAIESTRGGVSALVFHEGLKGAVKDCVRSVAAELEIEVFKHKRLREAASA